METIYSGNFLDPPDCMATREINKGRQVAENITDKLLSWVFHSLTLGLGSLVDLELYIRNNLD
jgi:hypothetical protein